MIRTAAAILMTVPQMQEAAGLGAFIEFVGSTLVSSDAPARYDRFAAAIRQLGRNPSSLVRTGTQMMTNP